MCVLSVQLNAAYVDGQFAWLDSELAKSPADHNLVLVRLYPGAEFLHQNISGILPGPSGSS